MFMWLYDIWEARHHRITPLRKLELEIIELKKSLDVKNKQIINIYELLETLTNESKAKMNLNEKQVKFNLDENNSNVQQEVNDGETETNNIS